MDRIVVGVDGSPAADHALRWASGEARLHGASIDVVHAYVIHPYSAMFGGTDRRLARERLERIVSRNGDVLEGVTWTSSLVDASGVAATAIVDAAGGADLLVVGSRGAGGFPRLRLGSTSYRVAAHASVPVVVVTPNAAVSTDAPVVIGLDDAPASRRALQWALREATTRDAGITAVRSYPLPTQLVGSVAVHHDLYDEIRRQSHDESVRITNEVLDDADAPDGLDIKRVIAPGPAAGALLDHADEAQLLVTGRRGHPALSRALFGSVSQQVLHHARGAVVVVP